jgi:Lrp/AsnC family transcriptional regulator, leucine-responsive regulatory protein
MRNKCAIILFICFTSDAMEIDTLDLELLRLLQNDNQQTVRTLAAKVGSSAPTCLRRLRALRKAGVIRFDCALLDAAKLELGLQCYVEVALNVHTAAASQSFERRMLHLKQVMECNEVAGESDFLLRVLVRDMAAFSDFARRHLGGDSNIKTFRSLFVMRQSKCEHRLPI